jgi:hypothetical protein
MVPNVKSIKMFLLLPGFLRRVLVLRNPSDLLNPVDRDFKLIDRENRTREHDTLACGRCDHDVIAMLLHVTEIVFHACSACGLTGAIMPTKYADENAESVCLSSFHLDSIPTS